MLWKDNMYYLGGELLHSLMDTLFVVERWSV